MGRDAGRGLDWAGLPVIATVAQLLCRELTLQNEYLRLAAHTSCWTARGLRASRGPKGAWSRLCHPFRGEMVSPHHPLSHDRTGASI
jgi:hypothetical protein